MFLVLLFSFFHHKIIAKKGCFTMQNKNRMLFIVLAVAFLLTTIGVTYFIRTKNVDTPIEDTGTKEEDKREDTTTKASKKDIVQGKKYVTMDTNSYIEFPLKGVFNKFSTKPDGSHTTDSGKYTVNNKRVTLDKLKTDAYHRGDYILIKDGLFGEKMYTMYYESTKNADFIKKLSEVLPDYIEKSVEKGDDLEKLMTKIEVADIEYCYQGDPDASEFSCSVNYKVFLKDYDMKKEDEYDTLFAGSNPTYKKDHVLRWSYFMIKPNGDTYKVIGAGTGK